MDLNKFAKRAYRCALRRGKITETEDLDVMHKEACVSVVDEATELAEASEAETSEHLTAFSASVEELADVAIVVFTELHRRGVDVEDLLHQKMKFNETRR